MKKNIFKDAKFGDKFLTKDERIAIYLDENNIAIYNPIGKYHIENYTNDGLYLPINGGFPNENNGLNIVSKYIDSIDESWMEEKALYSMPDDVKESNDYIQGWIDGAKYILD